MTRKTQEITIVLLVDDEGNAECACDDDAGVTATERFEETHHALSETCGFRSVRLVVTVPLPVEVELTGTAPEEGDATLAVK